LKSKNCKEDASMLSLTVLGVETAHGKDRKVRWYA